MALGKIRSGVGSKLVETGNVFREVAPEIGGRWDPHANVGMAKKADRTGRLMSRLGHSVLPKVGDTTSESFKVSIYRRGDTPETGPSKKIAILGFSSEGSLGDALRAKVFEQIPDAIDYCPTRLSDSQVNGIRRTNRVARLVQAALVMNEIADGSGIASSSQPELPPETN